MLLLMILLPLAAGSELYPGLKEERLSVIVKDISREAQEEILDTINDIRRTVMPTASNMLRMTWSDEAAKSAKNWSGACTPHSSMEKRVVSGLYCYESTLNSKYIKPWKEVIFTWYNNLTDQHFKFGDIFPRMFVPSHDQLILYNIHQVGCSEAFCPVNKEPFFYICYFCPVGSEPKQVLMPYKKGPPCEECPNDCVDNLCTNPCNYVDFAWNCEHLKTLFNCNEATMTDVCQATCNCETEIY